MGTTVFQNQKQNLPNLKHQVNSQNRSTKKDGAGTQVASSNNSVQKGINASSNHSQSIYGLNPFNPQSPQADYKNLTHISNLSRSSKSKKD